MDKVGILAIGLVVVVFLLVGALIIHNVRVSKIISTTPAINGTSSDSHYTHGKSTGIEESQEEVIYPSDWSASYPGKDSEELCGPNNENTLAHITSTQGLSLEYDCTEGELYNLVVYAKSIPPHTNIVVYYNGKEVGSKIVRESLSNAVLEIPVLCKGTGYYEIKTNLVILNTNICAGDTKGELCDWANNPEECETNCQNYDYCKPPYLVKVS